MAGHAMTTGIFIVRRINGQNVAKEIDPPPPGKRWLVVPIDAEMHDKISGLEPDGYWEEQLSNELGAATRRFFMERPVQLGEIRKSIQRPKFTLFDPRDPRKDPIN